MVFAAACANNREEEEVEVLEDIRRMTHLIESCLRLLSSHLTEA